MSLIVTNCTARKRGAQAALKLGAEFLGRDLSATVLNWKAAVSRFRPRAPAGQLYAGRAIVEVTRAAQSANASLYFVSAGMGLVSADEHIPAYDLTPADANGSLAGALRVHSSSAAEWWSALSNDGLSRLISGHADHLILVALPATYVRMVALDLARLGAADVHRIRIFTSAVGQREIPEVLRPSVMPYDERLESVPGFPGTRGDFAQRALCHFVENLAGLSCSVNEGRALVEEALRTHRVRTVPERRRLGDSEVRALIASRWWSCEGHSAKLLRALRDEEAVACEQSRFAQLWREVREQMARASG